MKSLCNLGYARGRCARFPAEHAVDALRFVIRGDRDGLIRIAWSQEAGHRPVAHGELSYCAETGFAERHPDAALQRQAETYLAAYLRRKQL